MSQIAIDRKYNDYIIDLPEPKMIETAHHHPLLVQWNSQAIGTPL
jgi:hypothetical protein